MPQDRVSLKDFRGKYKGSLDAIAHDLASQDKTRSEATETPGKRKKYVYLEYELQKQVVQYLNFKYPDVLFESSPINLNLTQAQRGMNGAIQKKDFHPPDIKIYEARQGHIGLALELKSKSPYLKDGVTLQKNKHLENQLRSIQQMRAKGWLAGFYWDFQQIREVLDWYLTS